MLVIDFLDKKLAKKIANKKQNLLFKTFVSQKSQEKNLTILDMTAGLGKDSFMLASFGFNVLGCEQNSCVYKALKNAKEELDKIDFAVAKRLNFLEVNSFEFLKKTTDVFDYIYFDPMFDAINDKTKAKKQMQFLRELTKTDNHEKQIVQSFNLARKKCAKFVIFKRHKRDNYFAKEHHSVLLANSVRFERYLPKV